MRTMQGRNRFLGMRNWKAFKMWKFCNQGGLGVLEPLTKDIRRNRRVQLLVQNKNRDAKQRWESLIRQKTLFGRFSYHKDNI